MQFIPPLEQRETEELIGIANCDNDDWQPEAKIQAKIVLEKREISEEFQREVLQRWENENREFLELQEIQFQKNEISEYKKFELVLIFLFSPFILLGKFHYDMSISDLKQQHFKKKSDQRLILLIAGLSFYILFFYCLKHYS